MAQQSSASPGCSNSQRDTGNLDDGEDGELQPKHKVFLSHSSAQKPFVEHLCEKLEECYRFPFFDKRRDSLPIGDDFSQLIFDAIRQCYIGVVILSEDFFTSKWPMMELVAMHDHVLDDARKGKSTFRIFPVFLYTSIKDLGDSIIRNRWLSCWKNFALENPKRVEVDKCEAALNYLRLTNGLVYDRQGEAKFKKFEKFKKLKKCKKFKNFEKEIVDEICKRVPADFMMDDSYIQGRGRICEEIQEKIETLQKNKNDVCVVGIYGMGGIGKTSICKVLCNEYFSKFRGKVCLAELKQGSEEELLREVLKRLTNKGHEYFEKFNVDELWNRLKEGVIEEAIFLALDNMSDSDASVSEVKRYLLAKLPPGSIVMVTARSKECLLRVRPHIDDESKCMEMPELTLEEAKSLFAKSSDLELRDDVDEGLVVKCVQRCYFEKNDGSGSFHYHPLALNVLGTGLSRLTKAKEWADVLKSTDEDIFNPSRDQDHPVFSIMRKSFDTLSREDQMLFVDVAIFLPDLHGFHQRYFRNSRGVRLYKVYKWLALVHGMRSAKDVKRALQRLKSKSLLERVDDEFGGMIGMHDLWWAFCKAETKYGELGQRRWVFEGKKYTSTELAESNPSGNCWEKVNRMAFFFEDGQSRRLEKVNFAHFSNVRVLKISGLNLSKELVVDLSGLGHLKSLDVVGGYVSKFLIIQGLPRSLLYLSVYSCHMMKDYSEQLVNQIASLKELRYLQLIQKGDAKLPDMSSMVSLRVAMFCTFDNVVTVIGLSSKLKKLRVLNLYGCVKLRTCPGVGDVVALEVLVCFGCRSLERLPNLRKLKNLRKLDISECDLITELPGLDELEALEELHGQITSSPQPKAFKLHDVSKLTDLQVLDLAGRRLKGEVVGLDSLLSLQNVAADFRDVLDKPTLRQQTKLQELRIRGWSAAGLRGVEDLAMVHTLDVRDCSGVDVLPDFRGLTCLRSLSMEDCEFKDVSSVSNLSTTLERLKISGCKKLERLPSLQRLTQLKSLSIRRCPMLRDLGFSHAEQGEECWDSDLADVMSIGAFSQLQALFIENLAVRELPDLSNIFPQLKNLELKSCDLLRKLTCHAEMNALTTLEVSSCRSLATLPDLCNFPALEGLEVENCDRVTMLTCSAPLPALQRLVLSGCHESHPHLRIMFPNLSSLRLKGRSRLSQSALDQLREHCLHVTYDPLGEAQSWRFPLLGVLMVVLALVAILVFREP